PVSDGEDTFFRARFSNFLKLAQAGHVDFSLLEPSRVGSELLMTLAVLAATPGEPGRLTGAEWQAARSQLSEMAGAQDEALAEVLGERGQQLRSVLDQEWPQPLADDANRALVFDAFGVLMDGDRQ